ncbi:hypothetical protein [Pelagibius marinus]|uniref:hypothetical protein n=1 Tax=Pelagibius marinus TaxID=2762760 RepID=UPI001872CD5C|nr:hypothetical protein [Pelagibius marinus]
MAVPPRAEAMPVLVPEAHALGMLAAIRSLGRAGYPVHAASPRADAIGFASRFCAVKEICPPYGSPDYTGWLRGYVASQGIGAIVPGGALLLAIEPCFDEFRHLLPIARDRQVVYRALSKVEVFEAFCQAPPSLGLLKHHPPTLVIDRAAARLSQDDAAHLGEPLYLKADARHAAPGADDMLCGPLQAQEAVDATLRALRTYRKVLLQGGVTGRQAGVTLLMDAGGTALASNCFVDVHPDPTRCGTMSLRRTWQNHHLVKDAVQRLRYLGWQGAAMLEYRIRDNDGSFDFIELNPRYWQSLHLDLLAGIDFPRLQMAWFEGRPLPPPTCARRVTCGDLWPGELTRMLEILRSPRFDAGLRLRETAAFLLRLCNPTIASDYAFPGDRGVYWHRVAEVALGWLRRPQKLKD